MISVVIPLYNETPIVPLLIRRLEAVQARLDELEFVFVDDGSRDATGETLQSEIGTLKKWQLIRLVRNFGQQAAYRAGLAHARGDAVLFLDADLQDPPELIPELVQLWKDGHKLVVPCRRTRQESGFRGLCMKAFHVLFYRLNNQIMPKNSGTFGLMDRSIAERLKAMPELSVLFQALRCWAGPAPYVVWYDRQERIGGKPSQSFLKLLDQAWNGITSYSDLPLRFIFWMGVCISIPSVLYAALLIGFKVCHWCGYNLVPQVQGFTTIATAILFMGGIQLISIGVLGEYIAKIFHEVKGRPPYIVASVTSSESRPAS